MKDHIMEEIFFIELLYFISLITIIILLIFIYFRAKKTPLLKALLTAASTIGVWIVGKILKTVAPTIELRWLFVEIELIAAAFFEVTFFEMSYIYSKGKAFRPSTRLVIYLLPIIQIIMLITNPIHHMFYKEFTYTSEIFGILFYVYMGIVYIFVALGLIMCLIEFKNRFRKEKIKGMVYLFAIVIPWVLNILYITGVLEKLMLKIGIRLVADITPLCITISIFLFAYIIFYHNFLDVIPILKWNLIENINKGIIILDLQYYIIECNEEACNILSIQNSYINFSKTLKEKGKEEAVYSNLYNKLCLGNTSSFEFMINNKFYQFNKKRYDDIGYLIIITDITDDIMLRVELIAKNNTISKMNYNLQKSIKISKEAARLNASNMVARELHDVLGHSITLSIKLLEVAKMEYSNKDLVIEKINSAIKIIEDGKKELKDSMIKSHELYNDTRYDTYKLKNELMQMIKLLNDVNTNVDLFIKGNYTILKLNTYNTIKRIVQEGITNSIKHGKANNIVLYVKFEDDLVEIRIIDDGLGCKKLILGNGLKGIQQRISNSQGVLRYFTNINEGFSLYVKFAI